jgi:hypothetical protein
MITFPEDLSTENARKTHGKQSRKGIRFAALRKISGHHRRRMATRPYPYPQQVDFFAPGAGHPQSPGPQDG